MSIHDVSFVFFRMLNFAALVALGVYVFYKYMLNGIQQKIAQQQAMRENKLRQKQLLHEENEKIKQSIQVQAQMGEDLLDKVAQWSVQVEKERVANKKYRDELRIQQEKKHERQREQRELYALKKLVMPGAIEQARKELIHQFAVENKSENYLNSLMAIINKSIS